MTVFNASNMTPDRANEIAARFVRSVDIKPCLSTGYLIKGWLGTSALSCLFGGSNSGKTFVALDMSFHIASGTPWRGRNVRNGPVVYVAAEGGGGIDNRFVAARDQRPEFAEADVTLLPLALNLHEGIDALAFCEALPVANPALIVIDTLARTMGDGDENTAKDMTRFIRSCDLIRQATGAHVMVVHHTGKDASKGARGSNTLYAATDTEIRITAEGGIDCTKQRDMAYPDSLQFALRTVDIGRDMDGDMVTSMVVDPADLPKPERKPLTGRNEIAVKALHEAIGKHGEFKEGGLYPHNLKVVLLERWREGCDAHGLTTGISDSAARTAFMRAKTKLMDLDEVREFGGYVWRVPDED